jgi:Flp pilus assembly protein TadG
MSKRVTSSRARFGDRRGVAASLIVMMLTVLLGAAALSVDLGMLVAARTEAQRSADAGALSGALSLMETPGDVDRAKQKAIEYAQMNDIRGTSNTVLLGDVDVVLAERRVRVRVIRSAARSSALANLFARVLGFETSDVSAEAAAHVAVAGGVNCPMPFAIIDRWWETSQGRLANSTEHYDGGSDEGGTDIYNEGPIESLPGSSIQNTGYGEPDRGRILRIYPPDPNAAPMPGWSYQLDLANGGAGVRSWIQGCEDPDRVFSYGDPIQVQQGMDVGNVNLGFDSLIAQDPTAYWGTGPNAPTGGCVFRPGDVDDNGDQVCVSSPRIRPAFLINPDQVDTWSAGSRDGGGLVGTVTGVVGGVTGALGLGGGSSGTGGGTLKTVTLQNFVGLFVICTGVLQPSQSSCTGSIQSPGGGVHVRFMDHHGVNVLPTGQAVGSLIKVLQLVE